MKKILLTFILLTFICLPIFATAEVNIKGTTKDTSETDRIIKGICSDNLETVNKAITINNVEVDLYVEFKDRKEALKKFEKEYKDILSTIQKEFELDKLSMNNWKDYKVALINTNEYEKNNRLIKMGQFFDIFENNDQNNTIEELASRLKSQEKEKISVAGNSLLKEIDLLTPYNSNKISSVSKDITLQGSPAIDVDDAVTYATDYATSYNTPEYDKFSSDCTNFASQILEAGGVSQEDYSPDETKGWWHTRKKVLWWYDHDHSISWIRADTFAKYMGVGYKTKVHKDFSENLQKGDFIAYDKSSDGDWDHIGFVTDIGGTVIEDGKTYTNYKVAQHTRNYHAWVNDDTNGWETLEDKGYTYGRVRR